MDIKGWKYYNHAVIPTTVPHEEVNLAPVKDGSIWRIKGGTPLLARWTTDFDCGYETNWWYCIKDTPFNISELKAKRRYVINKGCRSFEVRKIDPDEYLEEIYRIQVAAYSNYPRKYRPVIDKEQWIQMIREQWKEDTTVFGAFFRETGEMCGYAKLSKNGRTVNFDVLKVKPDAEKYQVNAAIVAEILKYYEKELESGWYICDGARNVRHETAFQDYLEKYFGFRKAYCVIHVVYRPGMGWLIKLLYRMRHFLKKLDGIGIVHSINGILCMEEIVRQQSRK